MVATGGVFPLGRLLAALGNSFLDPDSDCVGLLGALEGWPEELLGEPDDESGGEDSDDASALDTKLCTYIQTAKVFMSQHWYHCQGL